MREFIDLVEQTLLEVEGTYGWYNPATGEEIRRYRGADHYTAIVEDPERFGTTAAALAELSPLEITSVGIQAGWCRINVYRGCWLFEGKSHRIIRDSLDHYFYMHEESIYEVVIDISQEANKVSTTFTMVDHHEINRYIKFGRMPSKLAA